MVTDSDLLFINAKITGPVAGSDKNDWIAVRRGRISDWGKAGDLPAGDLNPGRTIDCRGNSLLPGFVDPHLHLSALAKRCLSLIVTPERGVRSIADLQEHIARAAKDRPQGAWIRAEGYHEFDFNEKRHPLGRDLDMAAPYHPVKLTHRSGHAHVLNTRAMEQAGIRDDTGDPPGGMIDRDPNTGRPTGLLFEMGRFLAARIPPPSRRELEAVVPQVNAGLLAGGITTVHDLSAHNGELQVERILDWRNRRLLTPKVHVAAGIAYFLARRSRQRDQDRALEEFRGVKIILDETTGRLHPHQNLLEKWVAAVHGQGMQVVIHAVEEAAIASAASAIELVLRHSPRADHRHRIEHCAVCPPDLQKKIADLGIRVVSQPGFLFFNGDRYLETVAPDKIPYLYAFGAMVRGGIRVAGSSDAPVAPASPLTAIQSAVTRKTAAGADIYPAEAVDLPTAIAMHTSYGAEVLFGENDIGLVAPGRAADMVLLDGDIGKQPPERIRELRVVATIIDGEVVWEAPSDPQTGISR